MSNALPEWLPELIDTNGTWAEVVAVLYEIFKRDFINGKPSFDGLPIWWDRHHEDGDQYEEGFLHLITRDDTDPANGRIPDLPRAQRLPWCRATIDNCSEPEVLVFDYAEGNGKRRTYIWLYQCDYVVVLNQLYRKGAANAFMLVTAFPLDGPSRRRAMQKKYDNREA
jgi:hypothetical protein